MQAGSFSLLGFYFISFIVKGFSLFFKCIAQVKSTIKGGKSCEIICLTIFLHHKNLAFEQGCDVKAHHGSSQ